MFGSIRRRGFLASINLGFSFVTKMVGSVVLCAAIFVAVVVDSTLSVPLGLARKRSSSLRFSSNFSSCKFPVLINKHNKEEELTCKFSSVLLSVLYGNTNISALILSARLVSPAFKLFSNSSRTCKPKSKTLQRLCVLYGILYRLDFLIRLSNVRLSVSVIEIPKVKLKQNVTRARYIWRITHRL
uniref:Uncharacterized protein n=1 Tax=Glossina pallidipes TaxID=7398 RepID=A0A1A9ZER8_GLOPL